MKHDTLIKLAGAGLVLVFTTFLFLLQKDCATFQQAVERRQQLRERMVQDCVDAGKREYECRALLE